MKKTKAEIEKVNEIWKDEDFHKVREAFMMYCVGEGFECMENKYIDELCRLLGITIQSYDEWDTGNWEFFENYYG